jgi:hypothetical protein
MTTANRPDDLSFALDQALALCATERSQENRSHTRLGV